MKPFNRIVAGLLSVGLFAAFASAQERYLLRSTKQRAIRHSGHSAQNSSPRPSGATPNIFLEFSTRRYS